jgi:hypothetical protein
MTATRDHDRTLRAWLDRMPDTAPDRVIDAVLLATEAAPQARALPWSGRWRFRMNRLTLVAATAAVLAALVGGIYLIGAGAKGPAPSPSATPAATPKPSHDLITPAAADLWGDWIADVDAIPEISMPKGMIQLSVDWQQGMSIFLQTTPDYRQLLQSTALNSGSGELRMRSDAANAQCDVNTVGTYRWTRSANGLFLDLQLVDDACATRGKVFARTWVHSLGAVNDGRTGVSYGYSPMVQLTLPAGQRYAADGGTDTPVLHTFQDATPYREVSIIENPGGFDAPCSTTNPKPKPLAHTTAALSSYVATLPKAIVSGGDAVEVDGKPGTSFTLQFNSTCVADGLPWLHPENLTDRTVWTIKEGDVLNCYVIQVDADHVFLIWYRGPEGEAQTMIGSVSFIDSLPTP